MNKKGLIEMTKMDMMMNDNELDNVVGGSTYAVFKDPNQNRYIAYMLDAKVDATRLKSGEFTQFNASMKEDILTFKAGRLDKFMKFAKKHGHEVVFVK